MYRIFRTFSTEERGYAAVLFGLLALPLIAIAGAAVDYRTIGREYTNMHAAAEAAAVAAVRAKYKPTIPGLDETHEVYEEVAQKVFNANFAYDPNKYADPPEPHFAYSDLDHTVTVTALAKVKTSLLQIIGLPTFQISVVARAATIFSSENVEVHFAIDVSPSMSAPSDGSDPPLFLNAGPGNGCYFMCHDDGSTIRASVMPKMDVIRQKLGKDSGMVDLINAAVASNALPIALNYSLHYFDVSASNSSYMNVPSDDVDDMKDDLSNGSYVLGANGASGGTDLNKSFDDLHQYFTVANPKPDGTRRVLIIISDGMHSRAAQPYNPAVCEALQDDADVYTVMVNNPFHVYDNANLTYAVPDGSGMLARDTWDLNQTVSTGGASPYGYYSGLNNAETLMKNCASKPTWFFRGETKEQLDKALDELTLAVTAPTVRVLN